MEHFELSRRKLLAGLAAAGGSGAMVGGGTAALFGPDREGIAGTVAGGTIDLGIDWSVTAGGSGSGFDDGNVRIPIEIGPSSLTGTVEFTLRHADPRSNPAYAWMAMACPVVSSPNARRLADALHLELSYADGGDTLVESQSVTSFADALASGRPLDPGGTAGVDPGEQDCLDRDDEIVLALDWQLDESFEGLADVELEFAFVGRQCRHRDGTHSPFPAGAGCDDPDRCECCVPVGKLEVDDELAAGELLEVGETYAFTEGSEDYELRILETDVKDVDDDPEDVAVRFEVLGIGDTDDPALCEVVIAGGGMSGTLETETYSFDGEHNDTGELLYAPELDHPNRDGTAYHGISHVTVSICQRGDVCEQRDDGWWSS